MNCILLFLNYNVQDKCRWTSHVYRGRIIATTSCNPPSKLNTLTTRGSEVRYSLSCTKKNVPMIGIFRTLIFLSSIVIPRSFYKFLNHIYVLLCCFSWQWCFLNVKTIQQPALLTFGSLRFQNLSQVKKKKRRTCTNITILNWLAFQSFHRTNPACFIRY